VTTAGRIRQRCAARLLPALLVVGAPLLALMVVEGGISLALVGRDFAGALAERDTVRTTQYDSLLGWVSRPNLFLRDFFGAGVHLRTNAWGLRGEGPVPSGPPAGRLRLVCSGDSYTHGLGVADTATWCAVLQQRDPRLETINLAETAYGLDQAYLRYRRDGTRLEPAFHVFAFIWDDFRRMRSARFLGFDKPRLVADGGTLRVANVPVPELSSRLPRLADWLYAGGVALAGLRSSRAVAWAKGAVESEPEVEGDDPLVEVVSLVFAELARDGQKRAGLLVVHLPALRDDATPEAAEWEVRMRRIAVTHRLDYLDLEPEFRKLTEAQRSEIFSPVHRHFSPAGHTWAASLIYAHLRGRIDSVAAGRH